MHTKVLQIWYTFVTDRTRTRNMFKLPFRVCSNRIMTNFTMSREMFIVWEFIFSLRILETHPTPPSHFILSTNLPIPFHRTRSATLDKYKTFISYPVKRGRGRQALVFMPEDTRSVSQEEEKKGIQRYVCTNPDGAAFVTLAQSWTPFFVDLLPPRRVDKDDDYPPLWVGGITCALCCVGSIWQHMLTINCWCCLDSL